MLLSGAPLEDVQPVLNDYQTYLNSFSQVYAGHAARFEQAATIAEIGARTAVFIGSGGNPYVLAGAFTVEAGIEFQDALEQNREFEPGNLGAAAADYATMAVSMPFMQWLGNTPLARTVGQFVDEAVLKGLQLSGQATDDLVPIAVRELDIPANLAREGLLSSGTNMVATPGGAIYG